MRNEAGFGPGRLWASVSLHPVSPLLLVQVSCHPGCHVSLYSVAAGTLTEKLRVRSGRSRLRRTGLEQFAMASPSQAPNVDAAEIPLASAFGQFATVGLDPQELDAFDQMVKALPEGTGDLDKLLEEEIKNSKGTAARANSLDFFRKMHSLRAMSLRVKAANIASASGDSGETDAEVVNVPNAGNATTTKDNATGRPSRQKRGRAKPVSRNSSFCDTPSEVLQDKVMKKERRMLSNRESARRSRRRKQEMMLDLENQVARLAEENDALRKRIKDLEARL